VASDLADKPTAAELAGTGGAASSAGGGAGTGGAAGSGGATDADAGTGGGAAGAGGGCPSPTTACDGACVDLSADPARCGACDVACTNAHGTTTCVAGACAPACEAGYGDCDGDAANGCETPTDADLGHCGACDVVCRNAHGATACVAGACAPACDAGFDTCGGAAEDGCTVELATSPAHCGACGHACAPGRPCAAGACGVGWMPVAAPAFPFGGRVKAAAAWLGDALFVWGGNDGVAAASNGALYAAATGAWSEVPAAGAPSARCLAAAVATGPGVVVWGGGACGSPDGAAFPGGARFDRATGTWSPISAVDAPAPRLAPVAAWTGSEVLVWGGTDGGAAVAGGALYDDAKDTWRAMSPGGAPAPRFDAAWAFGAGTLFVLGGRVSGTVTGDAYAYDVAKDKWRTLTASGAPSPRTSAFAAWTGSGLVVFGGLDPQGAALGDGARWDAATETWAALPAGPTPRAAPARRTGWVGAGPLGVAIAGGWDGAALLSDVHLLSPEGDAWTSAGAVPSGAAHEWGVGVWTGAELVLWGGLAGGALVATGERFAP
jgi:hypothetical protein